MQNFPSSISARWTANSVPVITLAKDTTMISRAIAYIEKETGKTFAPAAPSIEIFSDKGMQTR